MNEMMSAALGRVSFNTARNLIKRGATILPGSAWGHSAQETAMLLAEMENPQELTVRMIERDPQVAVEVIKMHNFPLAARAKAWEMLCRLELDRDIVEAVVLAEAETPASSKLNRTQDMIRLFGAANGEHLTSEQGREHLNWAVRNQVSLVDAVTSVVLPKGFFSGSGSWAPVNVKSVDQFIELLDAGREFNKMQLKMLEDSEELWDEEAEMEELKVKDKDVDKYTFVLPTKALLHKLDANATLEDAHATLKELLQGTPWDTPAVHVGSLLLSGKLGSFVDCINFMNNHVEYVEAMYHTAVQSAVTIQFYDADRKDGRYVYTPKEPHFWTLEDLKVAKELAAKHIKLSDPDREAHMRKEGTVDREIEVIAGQILDGFTTTYTMQALIERDAKLPLKRGTFTTYLGLKVDNYDYLLDVARKFKKNPSEHLFNQLERAIHVAANYPDEKETSYTFDKDYEKLIEVLGVDTLEEKEVILKLNRNTGMMRSIKSSTVNKFLKETFNQALQHVKITGEVHPIWEELMSFPDAHDFIKDTSLVSFLLLKKTPVTKDLLKQLVMPAINSKSFSCQTPANLNVGKLYFFLQKVMTGSPELLPPVMCNLLGIEAILKLSAETSFFQDNWEALNNNKEGEANWAEMFSRSSMLKLVRNSAVPMSALGGITASEAAEFFMPEDLTEEQVIALCDLLNEFTDTYAELLATVKAV